MNARSIRRSAVDTYLRLVRMPFDAAIGRLPGNGTGARPTAQLALDRVDASVRSFAGTILRDSVLREDADQRREALKEREHAQHLRGKAEEKTDQAEARFEERHDQIARDRARAELRATDRRKDADRKREDKTRRAEEAERKRLAASKAAATRADEAASKREPKAKLETLDAKAAALRKKEEALTASDEARRLAEAASRTKAERKSK
jgi:hypothetical protein